MSACFPVPKRIAYLLPVFFLVTALAGNEDRFWEKKDYRKWSKEECLQLLQDSPWAKHFSDTSVAVMGFGMGKTRGNSSLENSPYETTTTVTMAGQGRGGAMSGQNIQVQNENSNALPMANGVSAGSSSQPFIKYQVQFRSAMPMRQALVRQEQIERKYEKFSAQQRQIVDKQAETFLSTSMADMIIVTVTYSTNFPAYDLELTHHWQSQTTDSLKNAVNLIDSNGDKFPLSRYTPSVRGFQFIFPRQYEGRQFQAAPDKSIKLEFPYPPVGNMGDQRAFFEFPVEKMLINGKAIY